MMFQTYFTSVTAIVAVIGFSNVFHTFSMKISNLIASNEEMAKKI
jgi:hypothetical protein